MEDALWESKYTLCFFPLLISVAGWLEDAVIARAKIESSSSRRRIEAPAINRKATSAAGSRRCSCFRFERKPADAGRNNPLLIKS